MELLKDKMDNDFQNPPLFTACLQGNLEAFQLLLWSPDYITDINEDRGYLVMGGWAIFFAPPLWAAAVGGHLEIVRLLIESGANINALAVGGPLRSTSLEEVCELGSMQIVRLLVENGAMYRDLQDSHFTCFRHRERI